MQQAKIEGADELIKNIRKALLKHSVTEVRKALSRGAKIIVDAAKNNVRVNDGGNLKKSIKILPKYRKDPTNLYVGPKIIRRFTDKTSQKRKDENPFYAHFVEYGTDPHNLGYKGKFTTGKGGQHPGAKKQPYMRPALDNNTTAALNAAAEDLAKMIESGTK